MSALALLAASLVGGTGWASVSRELPAHSRTTLACPAGLHGADFDAATLQPFTPAPGAWADGGEAFRWRMGGRVVASARPSQVYGLDRITFRSYGQRVAVEIVCWDTSTSKGG